jgi:hypothetical protein
MVTTDELDPSRDLHLTTKVNGELRQDTTTKMMMLSFADLIAYVTRFMTLKPGDIISTGTPVGSGMGFDPPKWLKAGDTVEITAGDQTLKNTVVAESQRRASWRNRAKVVGWPPDTRARRSFTPLASPARHCRRVRGSRCRAASIPTVAGAPICRR